jgi:hypothetical protein
MEKAEIFSFPMVLELGGHRLGTEASYLNIHPRAEVQLDVTISYFSKVN